MEDEVPKSRTATRPSTKPPTHPPSHTSFWSSLGSPVFSFPQRRSQPHFLSKTKSPLTSIHTSASCSFRNKYLVVYLLSQASEWMQGPAAQYYFSHEIIELSLTDVSVLFLCEYAASGVFGCFCGTFADAFGCRTACLGYAVLCTLSCLLTRLSNLCGFAGLFLGKLVGGAAASLLETAFEAWVVDEHHNHGWSEQDLTATLARCSFCNGLLAILTGVFASFLINTTYGAAACFDVSFVLALLCGASIFLLFPASSSSSMSISTREEAFSSSNTSTSGGGSTMKHNSTPDTREYCSSSSTTRPCDSSCGNASRGTSSSNRTSTDSSSPGLHYTWCCHSQATSRVRNSYNTVPSTHCCYTCCWAASCHLGSRRAGSCCFNIRAPSHPAPCVHSNSTQFDTRGSPANGSTNNDHNSGSRSKGSSRANNRIFFTANSSSRANSNRTNKDSRADSSGGAVSNASGNLSSSGAATARGSCEYADGDYLRAWLALQRSSAGRARRATCVAGVNSNEEKEKMHATETLLRDSAAWKTWPARTPRRAVFSVHHSNSSSISCASLSFLSQSSQAGMHSLSSSPRRPTKDGKRKKEGKGHIRCTVSSSAGTRPLRREKICKLKTWKSASPYSREASGLSCGVQTVGRTDHSLRDAQTLADGHATTSVCAERTAGPKIILSVAPCSVFKPPSRDSAMPAYAERLFLETKTESASCGKQAIHEAVVDFAACDICTRVNGSPWSVHIPERKPHLLSNGSISTTPEKLLSARLDRRQTQHMDFFDVFTSDTIGRVERCSYCACEACRITLPAVVAPLPRREHGPEKAVPTGSKRLFLHASPTWFSLSSGCTASSTASVWAFDMPKATKRGEKAATKTQKAEAATMKQDQQILREKIPAPLFSAAVMRTLLHEDRSCTRAFTEKACNYVCMQGLHYLAGWGDVEPHKAEGFSSQIASRAKRERQFSQQRYGAHRSTKTLEQLGLPISAGKTRGASACNLQSKDIRKSERIRKSIDKKEETEFPGSPRTEDEGAAAERTWTPKCCVHLRERAEVLSDLHAQQVTCAGAQQQQQQNSSRSACTQEGASSVVTSGRMRTGDSVSLHVCQSRRLRGRGLFYLQSPGLARVQELGTPSAREPSDACAYGFHNMSVEEASIHSNRSESEEGCMQASFTAHVGASEGKCRQQRGDACVEEAHTRRLWQPNIQKQGDCAACMRGWTQAPMEEKPPNGRGQQKKRRESGGRRQRNNIACMKQTDQTSGVQQEGRACVLQGEISGMQSWGCRHRPLLRFVEATEDRSGDADNGASGCTSACNQWISNPQSQLCTSLHDWKPCACEGATDSEQSDSQKDGEKSTLCYYSMLCACPFSSSGSSSNTSFESVTGVQQGECSDSVPRVGAGPSIEYGMRMNDRRTRTKKNGKNAAWFNLRRWGCGTSCRSSNILGETQLQTAETHAAPGASLEREVPGRSEEETLKRRAATCTRKKVPSGRGAAGSSVNVAAQEKTKLNQHCWPRFSGAAACEREEKQTLKCSDCSVADGKKQIQFPKRPGEDAAAAIAMSVAFQSASEGISSRRPAATTFPTPLDTAAQTPFDAAVAGAAALSSSLNGSITAAPSHSCCSSPLSQCAQLAGAQQRQPSMYDQLRRGAAAIQTCESLQICGIIQISFEVPMLLFFIHWIPSLGSGIDAGLVFACFMACALLGTHLFLRECQRGRSLSSILTVSLYCGAAALLLSALRCTATVRLPAFCLFEVICGVYYPCIAAVRAKVLPSAHRATITSLYRVPVNVLLLLFSACFAGASAGTLFGALALFMAAGSTATVRLKV